MMHLWINHLGESLTYCHYDFNSGLILTTDGMYQLAETWQDILRLIGCTNNLEYSWTRQSQKCTQLHSLSHWENVSERHMDHPKWLKTCHFWGPTCKRTTMTTIIILDIEPSHNVLPSCERLLIVYYRSVKLSWLSWHDTGFELSGVGDSQLLKQTSHSYIAVHYFWSLSDSVVVSTIFCTNTICYISKTVVQIFWLYD